MVAWTAALFVIVEPLVGHVVEPHLTGQSTGLSPVAVVTSAAFWTWLWGPIGLVLATPLTMCLVVLGKHVDRLKFLDIMLGDEPALKPEELTYQRMLAGDPIEAAEQAHQILKEKPLIGYYQDVLIPALKLAQADADRGRLDEERKQRVRDVVAEILDDLEEHDDKPQLIPDVNEMAGPVLVEIKEDQASVAIADVSKQGPIKKRVLCIPGRDLLSEALALILAQLVSREGVPARAEQSDTLSMSRIVSLDTQDVELICLCFLGDVSAAHVSYAARRLRRKIPKAFIMVALTRNSSELNDDFKYSAGVEAVQHTLVGTRDEVLKVVRSSTDAVKNISALPLVG
jgi:hypothetical protein